MKSLVAVLQFTPCFGITVVVVLLHLDLPGAGIETVEPQAVVEEAGTAGDKGDQIFFHQHAAVDGPDAFQLLPRKVVEMVFRALEFPNQFAVAGAQAVYPAIAAAGKDAAFPIRGRRVDAAAGGVAPEDITGLQVEGVEGVGVDL